MLLVKKDQELLDQGIPATAEGQADGELPAAPNWRRAVTTVRNKPVQFDYAVVDPVPEVEEMRVSLRNPLTRPKTELYVWELNRKPPEPLVSETVLSQLKSDTGYDPETEKGLRHTIAQALQNALKGDEAYPEESKLWTWLQNAPFEHVTMFFLNLVAKLHTINLVFVEHNSMISYCTGSHNNAVPLGSLEQAKGAMFYITPYIAKNKMSLEQCLTVLHKAREHIKEHPSKADNTGTELRTVQHLLTRTLNKLNCLVEVSDYQVAAFLLSLPRKITSDTFTYTSPGACMAYQSYLLNKKEQNEAAFFRLQEQLNDIQDEQERQDQDEEEHQEDADFIDDSEDWGTNHVVEDDQHEGEVREVQQNIQMDERQRRWETSFDPNDVVEEFGRMPVYVIETIGTRKIKKPLPTPGHYPFRGPELCFMNHTEYAALIQLKQRRKSDVVSKTKHFAQQFPFAEQYDLHTAKAQMLKAKQSTVIFCGKQPSHPGPEPPQLPDTDNIRYKQWKKRADFFARYMLTMFRPEEAFYDASCQVNSYQYNWEALQEWIAQCQNDTSVISKFRLQSLFHRVHGLSTDFATKVILADYRGRNRTIWTPSQRANFFNDDYLKRKEKAHDRNELDDYLYEQKNKFLSDRINRSMDLQLEDNKALLDAFNTVYKPSVEHGPEDSSMQKNVPTAPDQKKHIATISTINASMAQETADKIHSKMKEHADQTNDGAVIQPHQTVLQEDPERNGKRISSF